MNKRMIAPLAFVSLGSVLYGAVPYSATRVISTTKINLKTGAVEDLQTEMMREIRGSDGSRRYFERPNGTYSLFRAQDGAHYTVDSRRRTVTMLTPPASYVETPRADLERRKAAATGEKTIAGVSCHVFPVRSNVANKQTSLCHALESDIVLEVISTYTDPNGEFKSITRNVITEIHLNEEPDPREFELPAGYTIVAGHGAGSQTAACASCKGR